MFPLKPPNYDFAVVPASLVSPLGLCLSFCDSGDYVKVNANVQFPCTHSVRPKLHIHTQNESKAAKA